MTGAELAILDRGAAPHSLARAATGAASGAVTTTMRGRTQRAGDRESTWPTSSAAADPGQHLGQRRLHPRALTRGEDDDCQRGLGRCQLWGLRFARSAPRAESLYA